MRNEILNVWLNCLRSGQYNYTRGALRNGDNFCPLGVLCDLTNIAEWNYTEEYERYEYLGESNYLPEKVAKWCGMTKEEADNLQAFVMIMCDNKKKTLEEIADILEERFKPKSDSINDLDLDLPIKES